MLLRPLTIITCTLSLSEIDSMSEKWPTFWVKTHLIFEVPVARSITIIFHYSTKKKGLLIKQGWAYIFKALCCCSCHRIRLRLEHSSTPPTISFQGMRVEQLIKWSCFLSTPQMGCIWEFFMHNAQEVHWHDLNGTKKNDLFEQEIMNVSP